MAIIGLPNCSCFIPAATQSARAPAILLPSVQTLLLNGCFIIFVSSFILPTKILSFYVIANKFRINFHKYAYFVTKTTYNTYNL